MAEREPVKLTKSKVDAIELVESGQVLYWDTELKGFGLRVGKNSKSYFVQGRIKGQDKEVRVTIGRHGVFTPDEARAEARKRLIQLSSGINPGDIDKERRAREKTLEQVFADFLSARKSLKQRTIYDYKRLLDTYISSWKSKPISEISKDMVEAKHSEIGENSEAQANYAMRFLRSVFNFAAGKYEDSNGDTLFEHNPVRRLSQTRAWYRIDRRKTVIKPHELKPWFKALNNVQNDDVCQSREMTRDYVIALLLTGLRRGEGGSLKKIDIDLIGRTLTIDDPKNHEEHILPLSDFLLDLFKRRIKASPNEFVFPGDGKTGHIVEPKKFIARIERDSGVEFTLHDLRRTFITIAESLDIPVYAVKRLVNHKMKNDVTAGYVVADVERLRAPMQKITDYILKCAGVKKSAQVVELKTANMQR
ncbi:MAG: integrase family protein [Betaproteobacteria bacterium]|nr:integrase family protein [Betaproteobacteria bacterium]